MNKTVPPLPLIFVILYVACIAIIHAIATN
jgi:hypothetical protein